MNTGADLLQRVKAGGGRLTRLRKAMLEELGASDGLLSARDMTKRLKTRGMAPHKTSVYREIDFFIRQGLISRIALGDREDRYELARTPHHHHAICEGCGRIEHVDLEAHIVRMERQLSRRRFQVSAHLIEFFGRCGNCR
ncbi:MAG TPA: Fur family transcriptional regulator [Nitrospiria bacterium]|nr:Fur family transcriptional regulator [Nitrospiria bacterium]